MARPSDRKGYVYVLHFEQPLAHAQHYVGCTRDIRQRLITHAQGRGSNLVRAAMAEGIEWRLGALGRTTIAGLYRIERQVKNWHGSRAFCSCCCGEEAKALPGCQGLPLDDIPYPIQSAALAKMSPARPRMTYRFTTDAESLALCESVRDLMQGDKHCLGFIPAGGAGGMTLNIAIGRVAVCECDGQLVGYCYFSESEEELKVQQIVVADSQRGCGIGRELVNMVRRKSPEKLTTCRVRWDLTANEFWEKCGFRRIATDTHETSGAQLNVFAADPVN